MSSNRPSAADYSSLASPDTESLLSEDQLQEKPSQYSKSAKSSRNSRIKTHLHAGAVVFYSALTVLLWIWSVKIKEKDCTCDNSLPYSPAQAAVRYEKQTIVHNLADNGKYRGPPRPEQDTAWDELLHYNNLRVEKEDLEKANTTSVPLHDSQGGYLVTLDVFHTLHCVNKIRKSYYSDYYHDPNPLADQHEHFDHCIDLLRQMTIGGRGPV
ncbi:Ff.00g016970.m01.CDS01 [Fusarium sp. VM40]|nr:Ff.00g016970.m01.CDS01 [Fusarium sp. VM40]